ncbi:MAG: hypothetical protein AB4352_00040 [Hormoscilla sp.]
MQSDPIVEEIHKIRLEIEAECDGDMNKILARAKEIEKQYADRVVSRPVGLPKPPPIGVGREIPFVHLRLTRTKFNDFIVEYLVESSDFNRGRSWQSVGKIVIDKIEKDYKFQPAKVWEERQIIPPEVYARELTATEPQFIYPDRWSAWSMLIHYWAVLLLESNTFPAYHPLSFFPDRVESVKAQAL